MLRWLSGVKSEPRSIFVTHGEPDAAEALAARITRERGFAARVPELGQAFELGAAARS